MSSDAVGTPLESVRTVGGRVTAFLRTVAEAMADESVSSARMAVCSTSLAVVLKVHTVTDPIRSA